MLYAVIAVLPEALRKMLAARLAPPDLLLTADTLHGMMDDATARFQEVKRDLGGGDYEQSIAFNPLLAPVNLVSRLNDLALFTLMRTMVVSRGVEEEEKKLKRAAARSGSGSSTEAARSDEYTTRLDTRTVRGMCALLPMRSRSNKFV